MFQLDIAPDELVIDGFAGGGGASEAIEEALGRPIDYAFNHDRKALAMHAVNHPRTKHFAEDIWHSDIGKVVDGRPVGLMWFSPDCRHHSKAKGGKPVEKKIRGLAWVILKWAGLVKPRVIGFENVEEFEQWGMVHRKPSSSKDRRKCKLCGKKYDGRPCPRHRGVTFKRFITQLRNLGYRVEWKPLRACDYGAPTIRKRLFLMARRDDRAITWPEPTHGKYAGMLPFRTAAECIDWSIPCPSIFMDTAEGKKMGIKRPLVDKTLRRVAKGIERFVLRNPKPYIVTVTHAGADRVSDIDGQFKTITAANRGELALVTPTLIQTGYGEREGQQPRALDLQKPLGTAVGTPKHALIAPILTRQFGESIGSAIEEPAPTTTADGGGHTAVTAIHIIKNFGGVIGAPATVPFPTTTARGTQNQILATHLLKMYGTATGSGMPEPLHAIPAQGNKHFVIHSVLEQKPSEERRAQVRRFLRQYLPHIKDFTVWIDGEAYEIVDIGMRMLGARELFDAQGFDKDYLIDGGPDVHNPEIWIKLTKTDQIHMCGNSVSPPPCRALILANFGRITPIQQRLAA